MTVANDSCLCGAIVVLSLEFHPGHRAEISHMNRPQNSSWLPSQPSNRAHMKRPLKNLGKGSIWLVSLPLLFKIFLLATNTSSERENSKSCRILKGNLTL